MRKNQDYLQNIAQYSFLTLQVTLRAIAIPWSFLGQLPMQFQIFSSVEDSRNQKQIHFVVSYHMGIVSKWLPISIEFVIRMSVDTKKFNITEGVQNIKLDIMTVIS